jgi:hypothetical protein
MQAVASELSVDTSEGETSGEDFSDGDLSDIGPLTTNHTEWFN